MMMQLITDVQHYDIVLNVATMARQSLWIGTADVKDLYVMQGRNERPFLGVLSDMLKRGVNIRLLHAKEPGPNFRADFDRYPLLATALERALCPRVHFKIIVVDRAICYVGSANLTGAGMGMKSATRRNFEAGILTDIPNIVDNAINEFDKVWRGSECHKCRRKSLCPDPIV